MDDPEHGADDEHGRVERDHEVPGHDHLVHTGWIELLGDVPEGEHPHEADPNERDQRVEELVDEDRPAHGLGDEPDQTGLDPETEIHAQPQLADPEGRSQEGDDSQRQNDAERRGKEEDEDEVDHGFLREVAPLPPSI